MFSMPANFSYRRLQTQRFRGKPGSQPVNKRSITGGETKLSCPLNLSRGPISGCERRHADQFGSGSIETLHIRFRYEVFERRRRGPGEEPVVGDLLNVVGLLVHLFDDFPNGGGKRKFPSYSDPITITTFQLLA